MNQKQEIVSPFTHPAIGRDEPYMPGEAGVWIMIMGDMMVFTMLFSVFLFYRANDLDAFLLSQSYLNQNYGAINTLFLLTSSLFVVLGLQAIRNGKLPLAPRFFAGALACGLAFCVVKVVEYREKVSQGHTLLSDDFYMFYYAITGTHFLHVIVGMVALSLMIWLSMKTEFSNIDIKLLEGGACFWHMVDLLWIVLFPLMYLIK